MCAATSSYGYWSCVDHARMPARYAVKEPLWPHFFLDFVFSDGFRPIFGISCLTLLFSQVRFSSDSDQRPLGDLVQRRTLSSLSHSNSTGSSSFRLRPKFTAPTRRKVFERNFHFPTQLPQVFSSQLTKFSRFSQLSQTFSISHFIRKKSHFGATFH